MIEQGRLSDHIGAIYDAALDPRLWPSTIEASCQLLKSCACGIAALDVMDPSANISAQFGIDQAYLELLGNGSRHPLIKNLMRSSIGEVGSAVSKMTEEGFRNSVLYQRWNEPKGYVVDLFNVTLERTATAVIHLGFVRHETVGIADAETLRDLSLLFPHYRRAVLIGKTIEQTRVEATSLSDALDGLAASVFLLDAANRIVYLNRAAESMLDEGLVARKSGDAIIICDKTADSTLRKTGAAIVGGELLNQESIAIAVRGLDGQPYIAHVLPLTSGVRQKAGRSYQAISALFLRSARFARPAALDAMAQLYSLTPAEVKTLVGVVELGSIPAAAKTHDVSRETIKTHLKRIFEKTGTSRQADLVKLLAGIISPLASDRE
jgi:DNA-binding CsgD family transcriptional regulator/PAS domain-containing protein